MDDPHFAALETKHDGLEALITAEHQRPLPDELRIAELKKQKLRLKEQIESRAR
jgi:hypothetical protein